MNTIFTTNRSRLAIVAGVSAAVAVAIGIGWGLASGGDPIEPTGAVPGATAIGTPTPTGPVGPSPDPAGTAAPGSPAGQTGGGGQPPVPPPPPPAATGPQIELFQVAQEPLCRRGTTQFPIEGRPLVLEWRVTGADAVTLSIDGPGVYGTYPAEGSDTLSFACTGKEGDVERHTYVLSATADGQTVTEELVVEAVVHEVTEV